MLFILFQLGSDRYALPARDVVEVLPLLAVKSVIGAPPGGAGLFDDRGTAVPVIDLAALALGRPSARRVSTRLLMVNYQPPRGGVRLLGVIAERATEMLSKEPAEFLPTGIVSETAPFLGPVARDARGLVQRVDVHLLLNDRVRAALFPDEVEPMVATSAIARSAS